MNQGRFRDYLNYLSMGPPSAQNWLRGWPLFNHGVHRFCEPANPRRGTNGPKVVFVTTCLIAVSAVLRWGYLLTYPWHWLRQWAWTPSLPSWSWGRWVSPGRPGWARYSGAQLGYFAHAVSYPVLDDLQHSIKFTYWYHQRNRIIYRLNGIKNTGVIVANKDTLVMIGDLSSHGVLLGILGFLL